MLELLALDIFFFLADFAEAGTQRLRKIRQYPKVFFPCLPPGVGEAFFNAPERLTKKKPALHFLRQRKASLEIQSR